MSWLIAVREPGIHNFSSLKYMKINNKKVVIIQFCSPSFILNNIATLKFIFNYSVYYKSRMEVNLPKNSKLSTFSICQHKTVYRSSLSTWFFLWPEIVASLLSAPHCWENTTCLFVQTGLTFLVLCFSQAQPYFY